MADLIHAQPGSPPWQPGEADTELVETYHEYDIPLVGVVRQHGVDYLFRCFYGHVEPLNLWTYTLVDADDLARLEATDGGEEFDRVARELAYRGAGVAALAVEDLGIIAAVDVDALDDASERSRAQDRLLDAFEAWVRTLAAAGEGARRHAVPA